MQYFVEDVEKQCCGFNAKKAFGDDNNNKQDMSP